MPSPVIAALDLGSNTFRLMLAERKGDLWAGKKVFQHIPRLSEHLEPGGSLAPEALNRAWGALEDFARQVRDSGARKILAGATMAARLAQDGPAFMAEIKRRFGWEAVILSGDQEARLTARGVLSGLETLPEQALIFDIGGRSTEFVSTRKQFIGQSRSLALGVVALTEKYLSDPVKAGQLAAVGREVRSILLSSDFSDVEPAALLTGTAGTVTTIAALLLALQDYDPDRVNNSRLSYRAIAGLLDSLAALTVGERVTRHGLHPRRADAIVAGLVEVLEIMTFFKREEIMVSDNGLLEGLWLQAAGLPGH
ncbi:MAG: hypothetical protein LBP33_12965 [Candidatus Adiutrix sp.]|nr:hypothetical protein [Candidatus Adiutrix sp.]